MARYENSKIRTANVRRGKSNSQVYNITSLSSTTYSIIPEVDSDIYVISQYGDRLDHLAQQYYGNVNLWWYIAKANGLSFMTMPPGTKLRIPATTQYAIGR
jgi:hypothetical protein